MEQGLDEHILGFGRRQAQPVGDLTGVFRYPP